MRQPIQTVVGLLGLGVLCAAPMVHAAGARTGVEPRHGEMVLLREVGARHAVRPAPPGIALIADPTPNRQLLPVLADGELSDADFRGLDTGPQTGGAAPSGAGLAAPMVRTLGSAGLGGPTRDAGGLQATGTLAGAGGPLGAVGQATRGIAGHVTGALSQLPLGQPAGGRGP
ncbi:hypothetical protein [Luteimonas deserti]|uniref:Uncharacterized protein n=1 Tax=Luteimonas deserti TaxID=2752306 RepID=A0A7Z0QMG3_9GAMM|nr:hypothetical protein [Luteimonas deserti]NYZ61303.1 hypothetical protein [Luteimonas deserti]